MNTFGGTNKPAGEGGASAHQASQEGGHAQHGGGGDDDNEVTTPAHGHHFFFPGTTPSTSHGDDDQQVTTPAPTPLGGHGRYRTLSGQFRGNEFGHASSLDQMRIVPYVPDWMVRRIQQNVYNQMKSRVVDQVLQCVQQTLRDMPLDYQTTSRSYSYLF